MSDKPRITRFELRNLVKIRRGIDRHNTNCPVPARAVLLNPLDHRLLGHDELWGIPVLADAGVPTRRARIDCEGSAADIERELTEFLLEKGGGN